MIEHSKRTRKEGFTALFWMLFTCIGLTGFQRYFFPNLWRDDLLFALAFYGIMTLVGSIACWYAIANIVANDEFRCVLNQEVLDCYCPVAGAGETFTIRLSSITKLEKEDWSESHRWYIWDADDQRYWLTSNFDNPCEQIIETIKELRPNLAQVGT